MSQHITVLLAAYNGAPYIEEQIRSILDQTLPPDQLLISDDGSTDGTMELLERLQAEYPSVIRLVSHKRESLDGGVTMLQLREKTLEEGAFLEEARALQALCRERHVPFIVNDNVDIARAMGADGVHVGQSDMAAKRARALLGPDKILGVSAHNAAEALAAQADGADYLGCGAAFVTGTKLDAHPVTAETMRAVTAAVNIPVVAIGGIDAANLLQLQGRGLAGVAVVSAIFAQADPCAASRELYRLAGQL